MIKINTRFYIITFVTSIIFFAWLILHDSWLMSIWLSSLLIIIFSWIQNRFNIDKIEIAIFPQKKISEVGSIFEERLEIQNRSGKFIHWVGILDHSEITRGINSRIITNLGRGQIGIFSTTVFLKRRGYYLLGPIEIITGDMLGLFSTSKKIYKFHSLAVYPKIFHLKMFHHLTSNEVGNLPLRVKTYQPTPQAAGIREYSSGDPLNHVHWPTTVKHNKLMVKEFDDDNQVIVWILLDSQKNIYVKENKANLPAFESNFLTMRKNKTFDLPKDSYEYAVSIAASITSYCIAKNFYVGFASASKNVFALQPEKGRRQLNKILDCLSIIQDDGNLAINQFYEKQKNIFLNGSSIILITCDKDMLWEKIYKDPKNKILKIILENNSFLDNPIKINKPTKKIFKDEIMVSYGNDIARVLSLN